MPPLLERSGISSISSAFFDPSTPIVASKCIPLWSTSTLHQSMQKSQDKSTSLKTFERMYALLEDFNRTYGHINIAKEHGQPDLRRWVQQCRRKYLWQALNSSDPTGKKERLDDVKIQQLSNLGLWSGTFSTRMPPIRALWSTMLERLSKYKQEHGTTNIDPTIDEQLCQWTRDLRVKFKRCALNMSTTSYLAKDKLKALEDLGFEWKKPNSRHSWNEMFPRLKAFYDKHGHANIPYDYHDTELYNWTRGIALRFKQYYIDKGSSPKPSPQTPRLSSVKLRQLKELGINRSFYFKKNTVQLLKEKRNEEELRSKKTRVWDAWFERLINYKKQHGTVEVCRELDEELFKWVRMTRRNFRQQALNLTQGKPLLRKLRPKKMALLKSIDFQWSSPLQKGRHLWSVMFPRLQKFHETYGHVQVPPDYSDQDLYHWLQGFISSYKAGSSSRSFNTSTREQFPLTFNKIRALKELGVEGLTVSKECGLTRGKSFKRLVEYWKLNGHLNVTMAEDSSLYFYICRLRKHYRWYMASDPKSRMSPKLLQKLKQMDFPFSSTKAASWEKRFQELREYKEKTGSANVPQKESENNALGRWCMNQRVQYQNRRNGKYSTLTPKRISRLESLGFEWYGRAQWEKMYERLMAFYRAEGSLEVWKSQEDTADLALWIDRQVINRGVLSKERFDKLNAIPGFFESRLPTLRRGRNRIGSLEDSRLYKIVRRGSEGAINWTETAMLLGEMSPGGRL